MKNRLLVFAFALSSLSFANSSGPPAGVAGAPGEADCTNCHGSATGAGKLTIAFADGTNTFTPGQKVRMKVTLEDPTALRWGFQLTSRKTSSTGEGIGKIESVDNLTFLQDGGGAEFISHSPSGTFRATRNSASWEFDWTAPAAGSGGVTFYAAGNAANNNTTETGDRIYKANFAVTEKVAVVDPPPVTVNTHSAGSVIFGGGWATTLYFVNGTDAEVSFDARMLKNDGTALDPATQSLKIPARGLGTVSLPTTGGLTQGYVGVNLPDGVTGTAMVKLTTQNQPDQELAIPFTKTNEQTRTTLIFDDTVINTQIAIANVGGAQGTFTLNVRDETGTSIGTSDIRLAAGARAVVLLKDRVAAAGGKRGTVEISASAGNVAASAIRIGGSALVATEAVQEVTQ